MATSPSAKKVNFHPSILRQTSSNMVSRHIGDKKMNRLFIALAIFFLHYASKTICIFKQISIQALTNLSDSRTREAHTKDKGV